MKRFLLEIKKQWKGTKKSWSVYWQIYGGWPSILTSIYFLAALIFTLLCFKAWFVKNENWAWFDLSTSVLPNILGFTLGGYAILLAFGSSKFMEVIAGDNEKKDDISPFMKINATFLHFIIVQVIALILSAFALVWDLRTGFVAFFGYLSFSYAIMVSVAAAFAILRLASWYNEFITIQRDNKN